MNSYEIRSKITLVPSSHLIGGLLFLDHWQDPEDFYTMSMKDRLKVRQRFAQYSKEPTQTNKWIWFGTYSKEGQPRLADNSIPSYLYQLLIKPSNKSRLRAVLTETRSDVNPFKYMDSMRRSSLDIAAHRKALIGANPIDSLPETQADSFKAAVEATLAEVKEYYFDTCTADEMKNMMLTFNHMPLAIDEAIKQSGLFTTA